VPTAVAKAVRRRIERHGERFWRYSDFADLPITAVTKALSRLEKSGQLQRLSKGVYYRSRPTAFGVSRPNKTLLQPMAAEKTPVFPAGLAAAGVLGLTTQNSSRQEVSTSALSLPRKLLGEDTIVYRSRPAAWRRLKPGDAAMLETLRKRASTSEFSREETLRRILEQLSATGRFEALMEVALTEPPRVRAMLGAMGQQLKKPKKYLQRLRASLNPASRYDFGLLAGLQHAEFWNARVRSPR